MQAELDQYFSARQQLELGLGLGLFHGFSKMLIALGLEPDEMATAIVTTPSPTGLTVTNAQADDPYSRLLELAPELATRWLHMQDRLHALEALPPASLEAARCRVAQLIGVDWAVTSSRGDDAAGATELAVTTAEAFVIDVRLIDSDERARITSAFTYPGMVQLIMALAIYDGIYRLAVTRGP